ncbi:hypothetical protein OROHE_014760 [Orobanche hederae]
MIIDKARIESIVSVFVTVYPHETYALIYSTSSFFFILSAYFVVLPLRDEGAISLGLGNLPGLFIGSLVLTLVAAPVSTLIFSLPNLPKGKALVLIHRFFSMSLVIFFILWLFSTPGSSLFHVEEMRLINSTIKGELKVAMNQTIPANSAGWENGGIALLNLITISSTWARVIDVMDSESGSRLFGFIGAGATLGQLFGSLFATGMAWLGPYLLLVAALLLEFAAQSSIGINKDSPQHPGELSPFRVFYKMRWDTREQEWLCDEYNKPPAFKNKEVLEGFSMDQIICTTLLSGSNYTTTKIPYVGPIRAAEPMKEYPDMKQFVLKYEWKKTKKRKKTKNIEKDKKDEEHVVWFKEQAVNAFNVFKYHWVYDPSEEKVVHLNMGFPAWKIQVHI